jgi:hypothetical protein
MTDEQFIERLRRQLAVFDRWRRPLLALYVALAVAFAWITAEAVMRLGDAAQPGNGRQGMIPGFAFGMLMGVGLGLTLQKIINALVLLFSGRRERLLVRCYDALRVTSPGVLDGSMPSGR